MNTAIGQRPQIDVIKGDAVPLSAAHRELVQIFVDYLRRLPGLGRNHQGEEEVGIKFGDPYYPLIALLLNHFSARDFGTRKYGKKYELANGFPPEVNAEIWQWLASARFVDVLSERRRDVLDAENDRRRAGEMWNYYVESRKKLGLKPAGAPWNVKKENA